MHKLWISVEALRNIKTELNFSIVDAATNLDRNYFAKCVSTGCFIIKATEL